MDMQWPREHMIDENRAALKQSQKTRQDFIDLIARISADDSPNLRKLADSVISESANIDSLQGQAKLAIEAQQIPNIEDVDGMIVTLACAYALAVIPEMDTWKKVRQIRSNSYQIEMWLSLALGAYSDVNPSFRVSFLSLAEAVYDSLESMQLESQWDRRNDARRSAALAWDQCQSKLEELWWGLRGHPDFDNYTEDLPILEIYFEISPANLVTRLSNSRNPGLVKATLFVCGIGSFSPSLESWIFFSKFCPPAFNDDGSWNGSIVFPLLLVAARSELLQYSSEVYRQPVSGYEIGALDPRPEILSTSEIILDVLQKRPDAIALFTRWSTWLMRQVLVHSTKDVTDDIGPAFVDKTLIEEIGKRCKAVSVLHVLPSDAYPWEYWCYQCVLSSHAHSGFIDPPSISEFKHDWRISTDEWAEGKGRELAARARHCGLTCKDFPSIAAQLLAYPIVRTGTPTATWLEMWNSAVALREVVEFGDFDADKDEYRSRCAASELLNLLFRIGLAMLDQQMNLEASTDITKGRQCGNLHQALFNSAREMYEVDDTLEQGRWRIALRHLATRRFLWASLYSSSQDEHNPHTFAHPDSPTFSDYLSDAKSDVFELIGILSSVLLNQPDMDALRREIRDAKIDIAQCVSLAGRLNQINSQRYPIDDGQLKSIQFLL